TSPTFIKEGIKKEKKEFHIPIGKKEKNIYGNSFEVKLKNELSQKAIAKECSEWIKKKVKFKSNITDGSLHGMINIVNESKNISYMPINSFTTVDLGYEKGNNLSNIITKFTDYNHSKQFLNLFDSIWNDKDKVEDVTQTIIDYISTVYKENSPEFIYFVTLYNIFNNFLDDISEELLPNEGVGFKETEIWKRMYDFQRDAVVG